MRIRSSGLTRAAAVLLVLAGIVTMPLGAAAESARPTLVFLTKEAVRLALGGVALGTARAVCPPLPELMARYAAADGAYLVCPICFTAKGLDDQQLIKGAALGGTVPMWEWIGEEGATTFSY